MKTDEDFGANQEVNMEVIDKITELYSNEPGNLLPILRDVQRETKYLSDEVLIRISDNLDIPLSQVYGVATFYSLFTVKPKGKYVIRVCEDAPCHVVGTPKLYSALEEYLGITAGQTTQDGLFSLEFTSCLGLCGVAPVIMVNEDVYGKLTSDMIPDILANYKK